MREFKFKVWDNVEKKMTEVNELHFNDDGTICGANVWHLNGEDTYPVEFKDKEAILLQYTGIKDESGIEIYEGDIVEDEYGYKYKVVYKPEWASFALKFNDNAGWNKTKYKHFVFDTDEYYAPKELMVVKSFKK